MNETDTSLRYTTATEECVSNDFFRHSLDDSHTSHLTQVFGQSLNTVELIVIHNRPCKHSSKLQLSIRFTPSRCLGETGFDETGFGETRFGETEFGETEFGEKEFGKKEIRRERIRANRDSAGKLRSITFRAFFDTFSFVSFDPSNN